MMREVPCPNCRHLNVGTGDAFRCYTCHQMFGAAGQPPPPPVARHSRTKRIIWALVIIGAVLSAFGASGAVKYDPSDPVNVHWAPADSPQCTDYNTSGVKYDCG